MGLARHKRKILYAVNEGSRPVCQRDSGSLNIDATAETLITTRLRNNDEQSNELSSNLNASWPSSKLTAAQAKRPPQNVDFGSLTLERKRNVDQSQQGRRTGDAGRAAAVEADRHED